jgi:hypothetical protein
MLYNKGNWKIEGDDALKNREKDVQSEKASKKKKSKKDGPTRAATTSKTKAPIVMQSTIIFKRIHYKDFGALSIADHVTFSDLPEHPIWSKVERHVDFSFADRLCTHLYTPHGHRPYCPSLKLKVHLVQILEKLTTSELEMRLLFDIAIKRFVGIPISFKGCEPKALELGNSLIESNLLEACFIHILLQAKPYIYKRALADSPTAQLISDYASEERLANYTAILQGMFKIVQHLKQNNPVLYRYLSKAFQLEEWFIRPPMPIHPDEKASAFSKLIVRAFTLLCWFENDAIRSLFWLWKDPAQQLRSLELQAALYESVCPIAYSHEWITL